MKTFLSIGLTAGAVGAVVAGGLTVNSFLAGGGTQPEDVLPADTIGFLKVDLDPSAGQKLNVLRLMQRFPDVDRKGEDLKRTVVESILEDSDLDLTYGTDVEPWLGDRLALAAVPSLERSSEDPVAPLAVIQFTDEEAMRAALAQAEKEAIAHYRETHSWMDQQPDPMEVEPGTAPGTARGSDLQGAPIDPVGPVHPDDYDPFDYAVRDGFVLISEHQAQVDRAARSEQVLADSGTFAVDKEAIDGTDQIVLGWLDVSAAFEAVPEGERAEFAETFGSARPGGRVILGVHAEPDAVEAVGATIDLEAGGTQALAAEEPGTGIVTDLPAETHVALSATGLGEVAADMWERYGEESSYSLDSDAEAMGLKMPDDLVAVLGQETAAGVVLPQGRGEEVMVTGRVTTDSPERALEVIDKLKQMEPSEEVFTSPAPGGYVLSTDRAHLADAADGDMSLADDEAFSNAVPDAADASALLFVDVRAVLGIFSAMGSSEETEPWEPLEAFGVTATGQDGNGEFTMRLTFR